MFIVHSSTLQGAAHGPGKEIRPLALIFWVLGRVDKTANEGVGLI